MSALLGVYIGRDESKALRIKKELEAENIETFIVYSGRDKILAVRDEDSDTAAKIVNQTLISF